MNSLQKEWKTASVNLGLEIELNFQLTIKTYRCTFDVLVKSFGAKNGMLVLSDYSLIEDHLDEIVDLGFSYSCMSIPGDDESYNRNDFIEILKDWGWLAKKQPPSWY